MKNLYEYKEVIHKCSKCGLCQSVCPAYQVTGNECTVSRGQFIMLSGIINGDLKMNKNINKYLDICMKCGKCSSFCPSDIDIVDVILAAKAEYFKHSLEGMLLKILQSKFVFNLILGILRFLFGRQKKIKKRFEKKAVYFGGCVETINPKNSQYIKQLLNDMNIEVLDKSFNCCGLPFLTSGNSERFLQQAKENIQKILDVDFDYFVTDCASCQWAWQKYIDYVDDGNLKAKLSTVNFVSIYDLISQNGLEFEAKELSTVTYHNPCHEKSDVVENIIRSIKNVEYVELDGKKDCCGFSGLLKPSARKVTNKITEKKKNNIIKTNADYIITSCIGCVLSLSLILNFKKKVVRLTDFLRKKCTKKKL